RLARASALVLSLSNEQSFKVTLSRPGGLNVLTEGFSGIGGRDLNLAVGRDANQDNVIDPGDIIDTSAFEQVWLGSVPAGEYFIRVRLSGVDGVFPYNLFVETDFAGESIGG